MFACGKRAAKLLSPLGGKTRITGGEGKRPICKNHHARKAVEEGTPPVAAREKAIEPPVTLGNDSSSKKRRRCRKARPVLKMGRRQGKSIEGSPATRTMS